VVTHSGLTEVTVKRFAKPILVTRTTWQVLGNATSWFDGMGVQDAMGATYLIIPFGESACQYVHVPELDGNRVINAYAGVRCAVLAVLEKKTGQYKKYEITFDKDYVGYSIIVSDMVDLDINIALLPKGVNAEIVSDGSLVISVPTTGVRNEVLDAKIGTLHQMTYWENRVLAIQGSKIWSVSLKS
jgi:hypothetical protein